MSFGSFLEYVSKYAAGELWTDHTYKNYDLLWNASNTRLRRALRDCGFRSEELSVSLAECVTRVGERGYCLSATEVEQCLLEWYVWRKIEGRGFRKWKYRD